MPQSGAAAHVPSGGSRVPRGRGWDTQCTYGLSSVSSPTVIASQAELKPSLPFRLRVRVRGSLPSSKQITTLQLYFNAYHQPWYVRLTRGTPQIHHRYTTAQIHHRYTTDYLNIPRFLTRHICHVMFTWTVCSCVPLSIAR